MFFTCPAAALSHFPNMLDVSAWGPAEETAKVRVAEEKAGRSSLHTHTQTYLFLCPGLLGGQQQQMVCNSSHCLRIRQHGARRALFAPWAGDAIAMSCISVTVNLFAIIKASPSGSTWQQRAAGGHRRRRRGRILQTNGSREALMFQHVRWHTHDMTRGQTLQTTFSDTSHLNHIPQILHQTWSWTLMATSWSSLKWVQQIIENKMLMEEVKKSYLLNPFFCCVLQNILKCVHKAEKSFMMLL